MNDRKTIHLEDCIPVACVADGILLARDGAVTFGWELFPPEEYTVTQEEYDSMTTMMASAFRGLPEWTMVHRQDVYRRRFYHAEPSGRFLDDCFTRHFEGRAYLEHRAFLWLTFNPALEGRAGAMKGAFQGAASGIRYRSPEIKGLGERLRQAESRFSEFVSVFASAGGFRSRRVTTEELEGVPGGDDGLLEEYLRWFGSPVDGTDILQTDGTYLDRDGRRLFSHSFSRTDDLPGEVSNTMRVRALSCEGCDVLLSSASPIGSGLAHEHIVNVYWLYPSQQHALRELDRRMRNMTSMSRGSAENTVNAEGIARFIDLIHSESTAALYTHMNILSWGPREEELAMRGAVGAALSSMGLTGRLNTTDTPQLWFAGIPGGAMEIGEDNLMIAELEQAVCLSVGESFVRDFPGGNLRITDRRRHVPVVVDTQRGAYGAKWIENYNAFILGPSGTGKSFFTNWYVRSCFDLGQSVFIIDKGDSYEGLCAVIREETGGRDGVYYTWDADHPFAFSPLEGCRQWRSDRDPVSGLSFFVSLLKIVWSPKGGWDSASDAVLFRIISDFLDTLPPDGGDPVFEDFHRFLREEVQPRILREPAPRRGRPRKKAAPAEPYVVGGVEVTPAVFDIRGFSVALDPYGAGGRFSFLLNEKHPADLFNSRFAVFEMDAVSDMDATLYALCTFCIIHSFERKMRSGGDEFRLLFIEEAWQAIATEGTADYLRGLWKTARKYHTSATVVTQQVSDIISSPVIKDAIIGNSPVKILLDQRSNAASFDQIAQLLGLSPVERALVRSVGRDLPEDARYREVFISLGGKHSGVYTLEVSPEEALVYESEKVAKRPLLERAAELGSIRRAVLELAGKNHKDTRP